MIIISIVVMLILCFTADTIFKFILKFFIEFFRFFIKFIIHIYNKLK